MRSQWYSYCENRQSKTLLTQSLRWVRLCLCWVYAEKEISLSSCWSFGDFEIRAKLKKVSPMFLICRPSFGLVDANCLTDEGRGGGHIFVLLWHFFQHCFICRPSDSSASEHAGIEPRTVEILALSIIRSNHSDRSHLQAKARGRTEFLDEIQTKVWRVFLLAIHSHLYNFVMRFIFLQTHATSKVFLQFSYCTL